MLLHAPTLLVEPEVRVNHAVRRLRWFRRAFLEQMSALTQACGIAYHVDTPRLADAFLAWSVEFERDKPANPQDKRRFVDHLSGLMLKALLRAGPLSAPHDPASAQSPDPVQYWPEGFAYVVFCLNMRAAVLAQDFDESTIPAPQLDDIRDWHSFRENVAHVPGRAVGFFQHFAGLTPDWTSGGFIPTPIPTLRIVARQGAEPRARVATRATLPANLAHVVFDLCAITNSAALAEQARAALLLRHGLPFTDGLRGQSLAATLTHIALATGTICPARSVQAFKAGLGQLYQDALALEPAAQQCLAMLSKAGVAVHLADEMDTGVDLPTLLGLTDTASLWTGPQAGATLWVSAMGLRLQQAADQGFQCLAVQGTGFERQRFDGPVISSLAAFSLFAL
jgi:hypothetical protein